MIAYGGKIMEIKTRQADGKPLTVIIEYPVWDNKTSRLAEKIRAFDLTVSGSSGGKVFQLHISDIYYAESVERKTFLYTKDEVYMTDKKIIRTGGNVKRGGDNTDKQVLPYECGYALQHKAADEQQT